jgi:hypothetical protein
MMRRNQFVIVVAVFVISAFAYGSPKREKSEVVGSSKYEDLVSLSKEWREFQKPKVSNGVPDYTAAAMKEQSLGLEKFKGRLAAIDCRAWPISQQVDYHLVRAEMNGLEFDHRVMHPWSRDPCFYNIGSLRLRIPKLPLADKDVADFRMKLQAIPKFLEQAKGNLTEEAKDLWFFGIQVKKKESATLADLAKQLAQHHADLVSDAERAKAAVDEFQAWLEKKQSKMTAASGIGIDNYNWYMKNVHLVPYTWEQQLGIVERELERASAFLKLEENRNRKLPKLERAASDEEYQRRFNVATNYIMEFYRQEEIFTVPDYMQIGPKNVFIPLGSTPEFFEQIELLDSLSMRTHATHQFDDLREEHDPPSSLIRRGLRTLGAFRAEGLATGNEEMMMALGVFDKGSPRVRELIYIQLANRAARAVADLKMHSNEFNIDEAANFAVEWTPRGYMPKAEVLKEAYTIWVDLQIYLHTPGYGVGYVVGKVQIDKLLADRAHQLGEKFILKQFMDEFYAAGMIPIALTRWEMTGLDDEIKKLQ